MSGLIALRRRLRRRLLNPPDTEGFLGAASAPGAPKALPVVGEPPVDVDSQSFLPPMSPATPAASAPEEDGFLPPLEQPSTSPTARPTPRPEPVPEPAPAKAAPVVPLGLYAPADEPPKPAAGGSGLADLGPGGEVTGPDGACYRITTGAAALGVDGAALAPAYHGAPRVGRSQLTRVLRLPPERVLFLDLETCGLRAQPLFLVGLATVGAEELDLDLLLARRPAEEAAVIALAAQRLAEAEAVVTFNGDRFDLPYLRDRAAWWRVPLTLPEVHLDLLPLSRRLWGGRFANCKLQTLEQGICGRRRSEVDVPGAEIPERYRRFVATGEAGLLRPILYHNAMDLAAMVALMHHGATEASAR